MKITRNKNIKISNLVWADTTEREKLTSLIEASEMMHNYYNANGVYITIDLTALDKIVMKEPTPGMIRISAKVPATIIYNGLFSYIRFAIKDFLAKCHIL